MERQALPLVTPQADHPLFLRPRDVRAIRLH